MKHPIAQQMRNGELFNPHFLRLRDIGTTLEFGWGEVHPDDVEKKCIVHENGLFYMENDEQRDRRLKREEHEFLYEMPPRHVDVFLDKCARCGRTQAEGNHLPPKVVQ